MASISKLDVAQGIDWLGGEIDGVDLDAASWHGVEDDGIVVLTGNTPSGGYVEVVVKIVSIEVEE